MAKEKKPPAIARKKPPAAARKKPPAAAAKKKTIKRRPVARTRARPAPAMAATVATRKALQLAVRSGTAALTEIPLSGWKNNRHGFSEGALSCYSCSWYQPFLNEPGGFGPQQDVGASQLGYCRAASVPITNLNMAVFYDSKPGSFRTSGYANANVGNNEVLTEVLIYDAPEFWCRIWTRTLNAFPWPPNYIEPPQVPNGGP
jgi:hypothetical protein